MCHRAGRLSDLPGHLVHKWKNRAWNPFCSTPKPVLLALLTRGHRGSLLAFRTKASSLSFLLTVG